MDFIFIWFIIYYLGIGYIGAQDYSLLIKDLCLASFWIVLVFYLKKTNSFNKYGFTFGKTKDFFKKKTGITVLLVFPLINVLLTCVYNAGSYLADNKNIIGELISIFFSVLAEELLFRGVLITYFKEVLKINNFKSIFISASLFSLFHLFNGNVGIYLVCQLFCAFCTGVLFGIVYLDVDSIYPSFLIHFLINITSLSLISDISLTETLIYMSVGLLYLVIGIYYKRKKGI